MFDGMEFRVRRKVVVCHYIIMAVYLTGMCPADMTDILAHLNRLNSRDNRYTGRHCRCTSHCYIETRAQHKEL